MMSRFWKFGKNSPTPTRNPMCMDGLKISPGCQCQMKITFVGDSGVGKTCFITTALKGVFPKVYIPNVCDLPTLDLEVQGVQFQCDLWDTTGRNDCYERLRPLSYPDTNIFCICFSVGSPQSLDEVLDRYVPEINHFKKPHDPIFLLGFQTDLRDDAATLEKLSQEDAVPVTKEKAEETARQIGAVAYIESSAIGGEADVLDTFFTMLRSVLEASPRLKERYSKRRVKMESKEKVRK